MAEERKVTLRLNVEPTAESQEAIKKVLADSKKAMKDAGNEGQKVAQQSGQAWEKTAKQTGQAWESVAKDSEKAWERARDRAKEAREEAERAKRKAREAKDEADKAAGAWERARQRAQVGMRQSAENAAMFGAGFADAQGRGGGMMGLVRGGALASMMQPHMRQRLEDEYTHREMQGLGPAGMRARLGMQMRAGVGALKAVGGRALMMTGIGALAGGTLKFATGPTGRASAYSSFAALSPFGFGGEHRTAAYNRLGDAALAGGVGKLAHPIRTLKGAIDKIFPAFDLLGEKAKAAAQRLSAVAAQNRLRQQLLAGSEMQFARDRFGVQMDIGARRGALRGHTAYEQNLDALMATEAEMDRMTVRSNNSNLSMAQRNEAARRLNELEADRVRLLERSYFLYKAETREIKQQGAAKRQQRESEIADIQGRRQNVEQQLQGLMARLGDMAPHEIGPIMELRRKMDRDGARSLSRQQRGILRSAGDPEINAQLDRVAIDEAAAAGHGNFFGRRMQEEARRLRAEEQRLIQINQENNITLEVRVEGREDAGDAAKEVLDDEFVRQRQRGVAAAHEAQGARDQAIVDPGDPAREADAARRQAFR